MTDDRKPTHVQLREIEELCGVSLADLHRRREVARKKAAEAENQKDG